MDGVFGLGGWQWIFILEGILSGFFFNCMIGLIKDEASSFPLALMPIAAVAAVGTVCVLALGRNQPRTMPVRA